MIPALTQRTRWMARGWTRGAAAVLFLSSQLAPTVLLANPSGEQVVAGVAAIDRAGSTLTVTQGSNKAIINWQDFSIGSGELTKFIQPSASSAALNRVTGGNLSSIYGTLQSNGKVFLINPNGIVVGASGVINTAGFTASTQGLSNQDFLDDNLQFKGDSTAAITNLGSISANGGDIFLIANKIENKGALTANGVVGLAAAQDVLLSEGEERLLVRPNLSGAGTVENSGIIQGAQAELKAAGGNVYALAIKNEGTIRATGSETVNGRVLLKAQGGGITNTGTITARNSNGSGGAIELAGGVSVGTPSAVTVSGLLDASAIQSSEADLISRLKGGSVTITGQEVKIESDARLSANGASGGGKILVGGDYQGKNPDVQNANKTTVAESAKIEADALVDGNGGKVILWSDDRTEFAGTISAKGGANGGNGGFAEVSGKQSLQYRGVTDLRADYGDWGTLLLDPAVINIVFSAPGVDDILVSTINGALSNVLVSATTQIGVQTNINMINAGVTLELAAPDIYLGGSVVTNNAAQVYNGNVHLQTSVILSAGTGTVEFKNKADSTSFTDLQINAQLIKLWDDITLYGGNHNYNGNILLENDVVISSGMGGDISFNGKINSFGVSRDLDVSVASGYFLNFNQAIGDTLVLDELIIGGGGTASINGGAMTKVNKLTVNQTTGASLVLDSDIDVKGDITVTAYDVTIKKLLETVGPGVGNIKFDIAGTFTQEDLGDINSTGSVEIKATNGTASVILGGGSFGDGFASIFTKDGKIEFDAPIVMAGNVKWDTTGGNMTPGADVKIVSTIDSNGGSRDLRIFAGTAGNVEFNELIGSVNRLDDFEAQGKDVKVDKNVTAESINLRAAGGTMYFANNVVLNASAGTAGSFTIQMEADTFNLGSGLVFNAGSTQGLGIRSLSGGFDGSDVAITAGLLGFEGVGDFIFTDAANQISKVATGNAGVDGSVDVFSTLNLEVTQTLDPDGNPINGIKIVNGAGTNSLHLESSASQLNVVGQIIGQGNVELELTNGGSFTVSSQIDTGAGGVDFTAGAPSTVYLGADITTDSGAVSFGPFGNTNVGVVLQAGKTINTNWDGSGGADISFNGSLDGAYDLILNAGTNGWIAFYSTGQTTGLNAVTVESAFTVQLFDNFKASKLLIQDVDSFSHLGGTLDLSSGTGTVLDVNSAAYTLQSTINAGTNTIHFHGATSGINATTESISAGAIALQGVGAFDFSGSKNIGTWAADVSGDLTLGNSSGADLTVGTVAGVSGLRSTGNNILINNFGASVFVNQAINSKLDTTINADADLIFGNGGSLRALNATLSSFGDMVLGSATIDNTLSLNQNAGVSSDIAQTGAIQAVTLNVSNALGSINLSNSGNKLDFLASALSNGGDVTIFEDDGMTVSGAVFATGNVTIGSFGGLTIASNISAFSGLLTVYTNFGNDVDVDTFGGSLSATQFVVYSTTGDFLTSLVFDDTINSPFYPSPGVQAGLNTLVLLTPATTNTLDNVDTQPYLNNPGPDIILVGGPEDGEVKYEPLVDIFGKGPDDSYNVDKDDKPIYMDDFGSPRIVGDPKIIVLLRDALGDKSQKDLLDALGISEEEFKDAAGGNLVMPGEVFDLTDLSSGSLATAPKALQDALSDKAKAELEAILGQILEAQGSLDGYTVTMGQVVDMNGVPLPNMPPVLVIALSPIAQLELERAMQ